MLCLYLNEIEDAGVDEVHDASSLVLLVIKMVMTRLMSPVPLDDN